MWALIDAGVKAVGAYSSASVQRAVTEQQNRQSAAEARFSNNVRGAGNAFAAARGSLSRYLQSVNNNQTLAAGGEALEANLINARRTEDTLSEASFEDQIRAAEQLGQQSAAAAFVGAGSEVADAVSVSTRLMQQRAALDAERNRDFRIYDTARRAASIQTQTIRGLDTSLIFDSLDYTMDVAQKQKAVNPWQSALLAAAGSVVDNKGAAIEQGQQLWKQASDSFANRGWGTGARFGNQDYGSYI